MADLITKSGDIWEHQHPCQNHVKSLTSCAVSGQTVYYVAKSSSSIPKVAVHMRDLGRHECYHECSISTHQYPPQSARITLESWPLVQFLTRQCQSFHLIWCCTWRTQGQSWVLHTLGLSWIGCLTSQLTIFQSYMWRHIDVQADWRRSSWTYGRAPNAIAIS